MSYIKIFVVMVAITFVSNCSDNSANDPIVQGYIAEFTNEKTSAKDAECLALSMKKTMPDDLFKSYYEMLTADDTDDMEVLGEQLNTGIAALPHMMTAAGECGIELDW